MAWLRDGEKSLKMFIRFETIHELDGRTDGQTHRHLMMAKAACDASNARHS